MSNAPAPPTPAPQTRARPALGPSTRARLEELIHLARTYRDWNREQLARALGRDASRLVPGSGVPKLDLIVRLARSLEWPVEDVVHAVSDLSPALEVPEDIDTEGSVEELRRRSFEAVSSGDYCSTLVLARGMFQRASRPEEQAIALSREAGAWDGLGCAVPQQVVTSLGLKITGCSESTQLLLRANLGNAYYCLRQHIEAMALTGEVIRSFPHSGHLGVHERVPLSTALYVYGSSGVLGDSTDCPDQAREMIRVLRYGCEVLESLCDDIPDGNYGDIASTCRAIALLARVRAQVSHAEDVVAELLDVLEVVIDPRQFPKGEALESLAWACVVGCHVAKELETADDRDRARAVFSNKLHELATYLGNWILLERYLSFEIPRYCGVGKTGFLLDAEDTRLVVGVMGRFPRFWDRGWSILEASQPLIWTA